jgi:hypothetical protein
LAQRSHSSGTGQRTDGRTVAAVFGWRSATRAWAWRIQGDGVDARGKGHPRLSEAVDEATRQAADGGAEIAAVPAEGSGASAQLEDELRAALEALRFYADSRNYRKLPDNRLGVAIHPSDVERDGGRMARLLVERLDASRAERRRRAP